MSSFYKKCAGSSSDNSSPRPTNKAGGMQRPLMSVDGILSKLTLSLMVINGH